MNSVQLRRALELADRILSRAQGIRIREIQAMAEGDWKRYKAQSDREWEELNSAHKELYELLSTE